MFYVCNLLFIFFFKQKTAYEMRISDWSSDVCSSDLPGRSKFYLSLQDDLMRIFGSERMDGMLSKLGLQEDEAIIHPWINKAIERAQAKVEARNFDIRKIGRAACRERVCNYVSNTVVAVTLNKKTQKKTQKAQT